MAAIITWIAVGAAVGYAACGRDARAMPVTWIPEVLGGAAGGFVGGGLIALLWNRASTHLEAIGVLFAAVMAATVAIALRGTYAGKRDLE